MKIMSGVLASILLMAASPAQEEPVLRYKFKKGETDQVKQSMDFKMAMEIGGQKIDTTLKQVMTASEEVTEVDADGNARMKELIAEIRADIAAPGGMKLTYDSTKEEDRKTAEDHPQLKIYNAMVGGSIKYTLSPLGAVSNLDFSQFGKDLENVPAAAGLRDMMKQATEQASMPVPKGALKKGDTWDNTTSQNVAGVGEMKSKTTFTFEGMEKVGDLSCARIKMSTKLTLEQAADAPVKATLNADESGGAMFFSLDQGRVVKGSTRVKFTLDIEGGGVKANQACEMSAEFGRIRKP